MHPTSPRIDRPGSADRVNEHAALVVERLGTRFGDRVAFDDVSFAVGYGDVFGFLGPNRAGKTTTVRTLGTLVAPSSGAATVAGIPLSEANGPAIRARISIMPESRGLYLRLTVSENLRCFPGLYELVDVPERSSGRCAPSICSTAPTTRAGHCPRACVSGSRWPARCSTTRPCCFSTSPRRGVTRSPRTTSTAAMFDRERLIAGARNGRASQRRAERPDPPAGRQTNR